MVKAISSIVKNGNLWFCQRDADEICQQYVRQAIICSGDTTLDFADDLTFGPDGNVTRYGFTGARSVHQCRDWDAIKAFAEKHKSGDRKGILV